MAPGVGRRVGGQGGRLLAAVGVVGAALGLTAPSTAAAPAPGLKIEQIDLGTMGGTSSRANAVDGSLVVGWSYLATLGAQEAFLADLRESKPKLRGLGQLPDGRGSEAKAVRDGVVVGTGWLPGGVQHAFAYDLRARHPVMHDLGTLGGRFSHATATDDGLVVGQADTDTGQHAFAYDLRAATSRMIDLGTLGGTQSEATAVDDGVVVGWSWLAGNGKQRAFAYDTKAVHPVMRSLGTLGGPNSTATAVTHGRVVGSADTWRHTTGSFAYDLHRAHPSMSALGTPGGDQSRALAAVPSVIVGEANRRAGSETHAVVWTSGTGPSRDLGTLGGGASSATAVSGRFVAGWWSGPPGYRGFVADLDAPDEGPYDLGYRSTATGISDRAVVGEGRAPNGELHAFAWRLRRGSRPSGAPS